MYRRPRSLRIDRFPCLRYCEGTSYHQLDVFLTAFHASWLKCLMSHLSPLPHLVNHSAKSTLRQVPSHTSFIRSLLTILFQYLDLPLHSLSLLSALPLHPSFVMGFRHSQFSVLLKLSVYLLLKILPEGMARYSGGPRGCHNEVWLRRDGRGDGALLSLDSLAVMDLMSFGVTDMLEMDFSCFRLVFDKCVIGR